MDLGAVAKVAGAIVLLCLALVIATMFMSGGGQEPVPADTTPAEITLRLGDAGILDAGGDQFAAYANLNYTGSKITLIEAEYLVYEKPPISSVYMLDYPRRGASEYDAFASSLSSGVSKYGRFVRNISVEEALTLRNSVIVIPSGGIPTPLIGAEGLPYLLQKGNAVIILSSDLSIGIRPDGTISQLQAGDIGRISANPYFIQKPTLDDWQNASAAGEEIARMALYNSWQAPKAQGVIRFPTGNASSGVFTAFSSPSSARFGYGRIIFRADTPDYYPSIHRFMDTRLLTKGQGVVNFTYSVFGDEEININYRKYENFTNTTHLILSARILRDQREAAKSQLEASDVLDLSLIERKRLQLNLTPGDYILQIVDQNGTSKAQGYLHVKSVEVRIAEARDVIYTMQLLLDGSPASSTKVRVSLDNSAPREILTDEQGLFTVSPVPSGDHVLSLTAYGRDITFPITSTKTSIASVLMQYYAGAALLVLLVFVATRRNVTQSARIMIDQPGSYKARIAKIRFPQLLEALELYEAERGWKRVPLSIGDVVIALKKYVTFEGKPVVATESNLLELLNTLVRKERLRHHFDYYVPSDWVKGDSAARSLCAARYVRDTLLELGYSAAEGGGYDFSVAAPQGRTLIHIYRGEESVAAALKHAGEGKSILLFTDRQALGKFRERLLEPSPEWARMLLETSHGRVEAVLMGDLRGMLAA